MPKLSAHRGYGANAGATLKEQQGALDHAAARLDAGDVALDLAGRRIGDECCQRLAAVLSASSTVRVLQLDGNCLSHKSAAALSDVLQPACSLNLHTFDLECNRLGDGGVERIAEALRANTTLKDLKLSHNGISSEGARGLAEALRTNGALQNLSLCGNHIGPKGARPLGEALRANTTLKILSLEGNGIGDVGVRHLCRALLANRTLKVLALGSNRITSQGAAAVAVMLKVNSGLSELSLAENQVGDDGCAKLAMALRNNSTLTELWLVNNVISQKGVAAFAEALEVNEKLHVLGITTLGGSAAGEDTPSAAQSPTPQFPPKEWTHDSFQSTTTALSQLTGSELHRNVDVTITACKASARKGQRSVAGEQLEWPFTKSGSIEVLKAWQGIGDFCGTNAALEEACPAVAPTAGASAQAFALGAGALGAARAEPLNFSRPLQALAGDCVGSLDGDELIDLYAQISEPQSLDAQDIPMDAGIASGPLQMQGFVDMTLQGVGTIHV